MAADGSDVEQLTNFGWTSDFPAWSPDGTKLAFAAYTDAPGRVFAASAPGTLAQDLYALSGGRRTLVASRRHTFTEPRSSRLHLTASGKRLIRRARTGRIEIRTAFTPVTGGRIAVTRRLRAGKGTPTKAIAMRAQSASFGGG